MLGEYGLDSLRHGEAEQAAGLRGQIAAAYRKGVAGAFVFSYTDDWFTGGHAVENWAFGITRAENGTDLVRGALRILDAPPVPAARVARTARIGVAYAGADAARPWRFVIRGSPAVSGRRVVSA